MFVLYRLALGVILFELVTGVPPFLGGTLPEICSKILTEPPTAIRRLLPASTLVVVVTMLATMVLLSPIGWQATAESGAWASASSRSSDRTSPPPRSVIGS